jgi:hypothetical protein
VVLFQHFLGVHCVVVLGLGLGLGLTILLADKGLSTCRNTRKLMMMDIAVDDTVALFVRFFRL